MFESINEPVDLRNTRFIFHTNFAGDPTKDAFGSNLRKATIIIPDADVAHALIDAGYNVKTTKPRRDDDPETFEPEYYIQIQAKYRTYQGVEVQYPPKIVLVSGNNSTDLTEETIGILDNIRVKNVKVRLNQYFNKMTNKKSLFIKIMYVEQNVDEDPFASDYEFNGDDPF